MTKFIFTLFIKIYLLYAFVSIINAQTKIDYAKWLYYNNDFFRAISVYKELQFFSTNLDSTLFYQYQIGKAYYRSGKYNNSIAEFASLLDKPVSNEMRSNCLNYIALNYLNLSLPNQALFYSKEAINFDSIKSSFTLGLIYANLYDWKQARYYFNLVNSNTSDTILSNIAKENIKWLNIVSNLPRKNPWFSFALSAIIPGAGQFYSKHYVDALQAFAFVASFAYMSSIAYKYDKIRNKGFYNFGLSISLTSIFYIANLIGAERTATYYNFKQNQEIVKKINASSILLFD